ncbi:hypothetical protein [Acidithrix ferrooxidans]|uniref:hypothetical protein n=1 Tax=Acidithrix ferrooxidans TaxID=1280514 RepID=UPI0006991DB5|nr:hypothetical protein [Acidithrix ferrooxidans]
MIVVQGAIRRANPYLYSPKPEALSDLDAYFPPLNPKTPVKENQNPRARRHEIDISRLPKPIQTARPTPIDYFKQLAHI